MTPEQLAEIKARAEKATPGPWECGDDGWPLWWPEEGRGALPWWANGLSENYNDPYHPYEISFPTIDFVAHARPGIPALLDYIEELQAELERRSWCSRVTSTNA